MTRSRDEVDRVLALSRAGRNQCEISRITGIPRLTINGWVNGRVPKRTRGTAGCFRCQQSFGIFPELRRASYAYLLGMYLGDGHLALAARNVRVLRVCLDRAYPVIAEECQAAMALVLPTSIASIGERASMNMLIVRSYGVHWSCLLPQHGPGMKHERRIELVGWQREILDRYPWRFLRGLIQSDGCRFQNPAIHPKKTYWYPRYAFSNRSAEIRDLFCEYCDKVGVEWRQMNRWNISVARRDSVALMDRHIGPKR
jgi:hypothetical protein